MLEITRFSNVSIVDFEQVNISWECSFILLKRPLYLFFLPLRESFSQRKVKIQSFFHPAFQCNNGKYDVITLDMLSSQ